MRYDRIIWDFNGTILDDVEICIKTANQMLLKFGLPEIKNINEYRYKFGFPIKDYYERLGFDFTKIDYKEPADYWVGLYNSEEKNIPLRDGIIEKLNFYRNAGIKQTILSATEQKMLERQTGYYGIDKIVDEIIGKEDHFASGKLSIAKKWAEIHKSEKALFIGDTLHDAEGARVIGCDCVLILGGHEDETRLYSSGYKIIGDLDSLDKIIM